MSKAKAQMSINFERFILDIKIYGQILMLNPGQLFAGVGFCAFGDNGFNNSGLPGLDKNIKVPGNPFGFLGPVTDPDPVEPGTHWITLIFFLSQRKKAFQQKDREKGNHHDDFDRCGNSRYFCSVFRIAFNIFPVDEIDAGIDHALIPDGTERPSDVGPLMSLEILGDG